jgi:hypothetical protein
MRRETDPDVDFRPMLSSRLELNDARLRQQSNGRSCKDARPILEAFEGLLVAFIQDTYESHGQRQRIVLVPPA